MCAPFVTFAIMIRQFVGQILSAIARPFFAGAGCVLCLHRVVPEDECAKIPDNRALEITPGDLRDLLAWVRRRGLEVIPLDQVPERLARPRGPKFIAFTFDDGYRDNLTEALPIFREFAMPFTVNVTTGFIARTHVPWWYLFEGVENGAAKLAEFAPAIRLLPPDEQRRRIAAMFPTVKCDLFMTWDEVRLLSKDPLVTIGAHTVSHASLSCLAPEAARGEMIESKRELEAQLGIDVRHFAYPFGGPAAAGEREFALAADCGIVTAVTTRSGNLIAADASRLHSLPRIGVSGNFLVVDRMVKLESGLIDAVARIKKDSSRA